MSADNPDLNQTWCRGLSNRGTIFSWRNSDFDTHLMIRIFKIVICKLTFQFIRSIKINTKISKSWIIPELNAIYLQFLISLNSTQCSCVPYIRQWIVIWVSFRLSFNITQHLFVASSGVIDKLKFASTWFQLQVISKKVSQADGVQRVEYLNVIG